MKLSAVVRREGQIYVAWTPELDIASQGETVEAAISNLREAVELYLEDEDAQVPEDSPLLTTFEVRHDEAAGAVSS